LKSENNIIYLSNLEDNYDFKILNKTNAIDDNFSDLKNKLWNYNGLSLERKKKFINEFLKTISNILK
jgi:hypothetical protein